MPRNDVSKTNLIQGPSLQYLTKHLRLTVVVLIIKLELQIEATQRNFLTNRKFQVFFLSCLCQVIEQLSNLQVWN